MNKEDFDQLNKAGALDQLDKAGALAQLDKAELDQFITYRV